jgi:hypothetical protein
MYEKDWYEKKHSGDLYHVRTHDTSNEAMGYVREEFSNIAHTVEVVCLRCPVCDENKDICCFSPGYPSTQFFVCSEGHIYVDNVYNIPARLFNINPSERTIIEHRGIGKKSPFDQNN